MFRSALPLFLSLLMLPTPCILAEESDPKARELLDRATKFLRARKSYQVDLNLRVEIAGEKEEDKRKDVTTVHLAVRRPDRIAIVTTEPGSFIPSTDGYLSDGKATIIMPGQGRITTGGVTKIESFFTDSALGYKEDIKGNVLFDANMGFAVWKDLAFAIPNSPWEKNLKRVKYHGEDNSLGEPAERIEIALATNQEGKDATLEMDLWFSKSAHPLPLKLVPHLDRLNPQAPADGASMVATWSDWELDAAVPDEGFQPPKAEKDEKEFRSFQAYVDSQSDTSIYQELLEKEAPDFELNVGEGKKAKLSDYRGKKVVILCFWGVGIEPSENAIEELIKIKAGRPFLLIGVNQGDSEEAVKKILDEKNWDLSVAMDAQLLIGARYKADRLPLTIVIDTEGKVRGVHLGYGPDFASDILSGFKEAAEEPLKPTEPPAEESPAKDKPAK